MELQREQSLPLKASLIHMAAGYLLSLQLQCAASHFRRFSDGGYNGMMVIPNLIGLFLLSGTVVKLVKENNEKHKKLKG